MLIYIYICIYGWRKNEKKKENKTGLEETSAPLVSTN